MSKPVRLLRAVDLPVGPDVRGILIISFAAIFIWFVAGRINSWVLPHRLHTVATRIDTVEETWTGKALAVRQENVTHSPASGRVTLLVNEGQRVRPGDVICEVNSAGELGALPASLDKIDQQLKLAEADVREARRDGAKKRSQLSEQLEALRQRVQSMQAAGRIEEARKTEGEQRSIEARLRTVAAAEAEDVLEADLRRQELLRQRETVSGGSRSDVYLMRAPAAGIVSFQFDGLEEVIPLDTPLHDVADMEKEGEIVKRSDGSKITAGAPLVRLINNYHLYLFVAVKGARPFKQGEIVRTELAGREVRMSVVRSEERTGKVLALLSGDTFLPEFVNVRYSDVRLSRGRHEGIVVPASSIVSDKDGQAGVFVMVERTPVYRNVHIGASDNTLTLIDGVPLGARVVTNPKILAKRLL